MPKDEEERLNAELVSERDGRLSWKAPLQGEGGSEPWEMAETQPLPSLPRPSWPTPTHLPLEEPFLGRGLRGAQIPVHTPLMGVGES